MNENERAADREDLERALKDPTAVFASPSEVLERIAWTREERRQVLDQWQQDAESLQVAASESMDGGESARLQEVLLAIGALEKNDGSRR